MFGTIPDNSGIVVSNVKVQRLVPTEEAFTEELDYSEGEIATFETISGSLAATSWMTSILRSVISSTPISIFFLSFLNYFSLSGLYVLLNFPVPSRIYEILSQVYWQINQ